MVLGKFRQLLDWSKKAVKKIKSVIPSILRIYRTVAPSIKEAIPQFGPIKERLDEFADVGEAVGKDDWNEVKRRGGKIVERVEQGRLLPDKKEFKFKRGGKAPPFIALNQKV